MKKWQTAFSIAILSGLFLSVSGAGRADGHTATPLTVQLGPRPYFLVNDMDDGPLKERLASCADMSFEPSDLSIGHRGAALQFPEHTAESYRAAARTGAGIVECDVTFTADKELVCRHSQCDLHTTTNILAVPALAAKCSTPFTPATFDAAGKRISAANAKCCTSDITLAEFKTLKGKMDAADKNATTPQAYLGGTAAYRTDLYTPRGTLLTHAESIELFKELGVKMTPELKSPAVDMPYDGDYTQSAYAQQLINEYKAAGVPPANVWPQSFNIDDIRYWINKEPDFGKQGVYLDSRYRDSSFDINDESSWSPTMDEMVSDGVNILAPPMWMLLSTDTDNKIIPSSYAIAAKRAGLQLITWTLERSGFLASGGGWYYQSISSAINNDGDMMNALHVLVQDVGVIGVFSDWPATVTYYANCMNNK